VAKRAPRVSKSFVTITDKPVTELNTLQAKEVVHPAT
jgi:hypothetical protein